MPKTFRHAILGIVLMIGTHVALYSQQPNDVVGFWISAQKNVIVQIFDSSGTYRGKIVWFDDTDDPGRPMKLRADIHNPVTALRTRTVLGLEVLTELSFVDKCKCWQNGKIYDTQTGKTWDATVFQENINRLRVRGFWHFQFLGKSMIFQRYTGPIHPDWGT